VYEYTATLFTGIAQTGLYVTDTNIGQFYNYSSLTNYFDLKNGTYCHPYWWYSIYRNAKAKFECAQETKFSVVEAPTCVYTLHYYGPGFCTNGNYPYLSGEPSLTPTTSPTAAPTLAGLHIPAYATLTEDYVKSVLLSLAGGVWAQKNNWKASKSLTSWQAIDVHVDPTTGNLTAPMEIYHAPNVYFMTTFPTEFALLKNGISVLSVAGCGITGTIPSFLADFVYLERLVLYNNGFTGPIPFGIGSNTALRELYLQDNNLASTIPKDMFLHALHIDLGSNDLTGPIPTVFGSALQSLHLDSNGLSGTLPWQVNTSSILELDLSNNNLHGKMPESLCDQKYFILYLAGNSLGCYPSCIQAGVSDITSAYSRCPGLVDYGLCDLEATFNISGLISKTKVPGTVWRYDSAHPLAYVWEGKQTYSSSGADLLSIAFDCRSQLSVVLLRIYDDDGNSLFDASDLDFTSIPGCGLEAPLVLAVNSISMVFSNWESMETWGFAATITPFSYPKGWDCNHVFDDDTTLGFTFYSYAKDYCSWYGVTCESGVSLRRLDLSTVGLWGTLPYSIGFLENIEYLDLGYNSISGSIPWTLGILSDLRTLTLQSNYLNGTIPSEVGLLTNMVDLNIAGNSLSGTMPLFLDTFMELQVLDLSSNNFHGKISPELCSLANISNLDAQLQNNHFSCYESHCFAGSPLRFDHSVGYCAPTAMPTPAPTSKAETKTVSTKLITGASVGGGVGGLAAFVLAYFAWRWFRRSDKYRCLGLPLHYAVVKKQEVTEEMLVRHMSTINGVTTDKKTIIDLIIATPACLVSATVLSKLLLALMLEEDKQTEEMQLIKTGMMPFSSTMFAMKPSDNPPLEPNGGTDINKNEIELVPPGPGLVMASNKIAVAPAEIIDPAIGDSVVASKYELAEKPAAGMDVFNGLTAVMKGGGGEAAATAAVTIRYHFWILVVQEERELFQEAVYLVVQANPERITELSELTDARARRCIDIASIPCKEILRRCSYLLYRYELKPGPHEHKSATSDVVFAADHGEWSFEKTRKSDPLNAMVSPRTPQSSIIAIPSKDVCLKFMRNKDQYLREIEVRERANLDPDCVIAIVSKFDGDSTSNENEANFRKGAVTQGFKDYPYCIVMDRAELSLKRIIDHGHIVGEDWDAIKTMFKQIVHAVEHMHDRKIIHGDLKPMNIMQGSGKMILIDLDASASFSESNPQYAGAKFSSAYTPPELICIGDDGNARVRVPPVGEDGELVSPASVEAAMRSGDSLLKKQAADSGSLSPVHLKSVKLPSYSMVRAHPSLDMWSLGALLYLLCSGMNLFRATVEDNVGSDMDLRALMEWAIGTKENCLSVVKDKMARNLISLLLHKNPERRLNCSQIMSHPFFTGKMPDRLQGEKAKFDVFLSYRVSSDSGHVKQLHDLLEAKGLKVWWDKKCLLPGQPWEEGFCAGLANSGHFVCLLSRGAINSDKAWENFSKLESGSRCDNVLLEWRLALELKRRGMIEGVFPVMIGDPMEDMESHAFTYSHYFSSGCHPRELPPWSVVSVEQKLMEHLDREGLGHPLEESMTVSSVVSEVLANQGGFIVGQPAKAWDDVVTEITRMISVTSSRHVQEEAQLISSPNSGSVANTARSNNAAAATNNNGSDISMKYERLLEENKILKLQLTARKTD
jgi:serine/threonine protein kinase/Leucine-rich repeat (LRR) protein